MRRRTALGLGVAALLFATGFGGSERLFAPAADPWEKWRAHDPSSGGVIHHGLWDRFLKKYVAADPDGPNRFRYGAVTDADEEILARYLGTLGAINIAGYNRDQQLAYWINLYNALTVQVVLDHYPVASIRDIDISPGRFADGPWGKPVFHLDGETLSLNDIEHRILRPLWRDPRVHYGLNCASIGCPDLLPFAYAGATVNQQLEDAATAYVNDPRGVSIKDDQVTVSKIYDWFHADFGGTDAGVLTHLRRYAAPPLASTLARIGAIHEAAYDWGLNDAE